MKILLRPRETEISKEEIIKNINLAEEAKPLKISLRRLKQDSNFEELWNRQQQKTEKGGKLRQ